MKDVFCAIDLGATSGRVIISADGQTMEEVHRFPNEVLHQDGRCFWDTDALMQEVTTGLRMLAKRNDIRLRSIGVDTWGVDVVFLDKDGQPLSRPRAYRDPYTNNIMDRFFAQKMSRDEVYRRTGIQMMPFNTLFQFFACWQEQFAPFLQAEHYLFMPDYISYCLTGKMVTEYTILSTSQMLNPNTHTIDAELVAATGACADKFPPIVYPGHVVGTLRSEIADFGYEVPIVAVAGHDTASAVASVPQTIADNQHIAYLSSGTWSLMGIVTDQPVITPQSAQLNFTNEGGLDGTTRLLKNITGMWILEQCRREWLTMGRDYTYTQIADMAAQCPATDTIIFNPDEPRFANPESMLREVTNGQVMSDAAVMASIFRSLANRYAEVFHMLQQLAPWAIHALYIIGGGARNSLLNRLTEEAIGIPVIVGHTEATAMGNIAVQINRLINQ